MKIGLDMMGGDFAPLEAAKGVGLHLSQQGSPDDLVLLGEAYAVSEALKAQSLDPAHFHIVDTPERIEMHEHPTKALKEKRRSSISVGFGLLAEGRLDAFISAGNTGAMLVGSMFSIKALPGVLRPTIGAYMPRENGGLGLLLDAGINSDCKPEHLAQFAVLGSLFVQHVWEVEDPRVALLNIGEEEGKGNLLAQAAYPMLKETPGVRFVGNVEGRDIFLDKADVMVCDGFTGNVVLKLAESFYDLLKRRRVEDEYFERFNYEQYGGVPILGVSKPVIIGHGISHAESFKNMVRLAETMIRKDLLGKMREAFATESEV